MGRILPRGGKGSLWKRAARNAPGGPFPPLVSFIAPGRSALETRRGRIPGLVTSARLEGPGLRPPPPLGSPPKAAAFPKVASSSSSASPFFPLPRSSQTKSAPARAPPTSRADQTAPMAAGDEGERDRGSGHGSKATPTLAAPAFYGPRWPALPRGAQSSAIKTQLSQPRPGAAAPRSGQATGALSFSNIFHFRLRQ